MNRELFGITSQPVTVGGNKLNAICKYDGLKLEYWNREKRVFTDSIFNATLWPDDLPGETPYLKNNVYSLFSGFQTSKGYILSAISSGLYPCCIEKDGKYYQSKDKWVSRWEECKWFMGPYKCLEILWELENEKEIHHRLQ
jgi:hypothetical protein